jgi:hypothetical protein
MASSIAIDGAGPPAASTAALKAKLGAMGAAVQVDRTPLAEPGAEGARASSKPSCCQAQRA